jgi:hypothetical protein
LKLIKKSKEEFIELIFEEPVESVQAWPIVALDLPGIFYGVHTWHRSPERSGQLRP